MSSCCFCFARIFPAVLAEFETAAAHLSLHPGWYTRGEGDYRLSVWLLAYLSVLFLQLQAVVVLVSTASSGHRKL